MEGSMEKSAIRKMQTFYNGYFRLAILFVICSLSFTNAQFAHPGIFNSQEELDFIKAKVNGTESHPMKTGYQTMKTFSGANLSYTPNALVNVTVVASSVGPEEANFRDAAQAVYVHALQWVITGNAANKDKAIQILNAWSSVFKAMMPTDAQRQLEAAWVLPTWVAGAEIIRHYNQGAAGWAAADIAKFCGLLDTLYNYTKIIYTDKRTNNWGSSAALAMMAVGAFENDTTKFSAGRQFYLFLLPYQVEKTGLLMETCRDCNHAEYNLIGMLQAAELAWHQGVDLYGIKLDNQTLPRLLMGMEFHANAMLGTPLNVGQSCGAVNCSGDDRHGPGWEMGRNHYKFRANLGSSIPATEKFVTTINRPVGTSENHFVEWTTLTHADLGNLTVPVATAGRIQGASLQAAHATVFYYQQGSSMPYPWQRLGLESENAGIEIMDLQGRRVSVFKTCASSVRRAGIPGLCSGTYLYSLTK
jgi:hypothetical protein